MKILYINASDMNFDPLRLSSFKMFSAKDFDILLSALSDEINSRCTASAKHDLYITGGGAMLLSIGMNRRTTDLDVVVRDGDTIIADCAKEVAKKLNISSGWCNDMIRKTRSYTPAIFSNSTLYKQYGILNVYTVDPGLLLCMKLIAFREKDINDIEYIISVLESDGDIVDMRLVNQMFYDHYVSHGIQPRFCQDAILYIKGRFS